MRYILIISLYVQDLIFTGSDEKLIEEFKENMAKKYEMSDFKFLHYLGIEIHQKEKSIFISQRKYDKMIFEKFGMSNCNWVATPLTMNEKLKNKMEIKKLMNLFIEA